jgi:hypothetical protein
MYEQFLVFGQSNPNTELLNPIRMNQLGRIEIYLRISLDEWELLLSETVQSNPIRSYSIP